MSERDRLLRQAIFDPGSVVGPRLSPSWPVGHPGHSAREESVPEWQVRAVRTVLDEEATDTAV